MSHILFSLTETSTPCLQGQTAGRTPPRIGHGTWRCNKTPEGTGINATADLVLMLSGACTKDSGIRGNVIGFNEAILVLDNFLSFTVFSCARAKTFTPFGLFAFQSSLHPHRTLDCQTYIYIIHLYNHLLKMRGYIKPQLKM